MAKLQVLETRLREILAEKAQLERELLSSRKANVGIRDVNRKNSVVRILVETAVVDALTASGKPLTSAELFAASQKFDHDLNPSTFRAYLHRMRTKGVIAPAEKLGTWRLYSSLTNRLRPIPHE